ncbi:hypothetical protein THASP1DRAFT_2055, partial [Thamnocephalis sphaerospora]
DKRTVLRKELSEIRNKQASLKKSRQDVFNRLEAINKSVKSKVDELRAAKSKAPYKSVDEIDDEISRQEKRIESGQLKLVEEKRAITEITAMKKARRAVETFDEQQAAIDEEKKRADAVRAELDTFDNKALSKRYTEIQEELDTLTKAKDADWDKRKELFAQRDQLQKELDEQFNARRAQQTANREANDAYYQWQQEDRVRRQEAMRARRQREYEEDLEAQIEEVRDAAAAPAFTAEMESCDAIIAYIQINLLSGRGAKADDVTAAAAEPAGGKLELRRVDPNTNAPKGTVLKKKADREDDYFAGRQTVAKKQQQKPSEPRKEAPLKLPLSVMERFWEIKVEVPTSRDSLSNALSAVEERKKWYVEHQAEESAANKQRAEERIVELTRKAAEA